MANASSPGSVQILRLNVGGMCCSEEAEQIEAACSRITGVAHARALVAAERVEVTFDSAKATAEDIRGAIAGAGFSVRDESWSAARSVPSVWPLVLLVFGVIVAVSIGEVTGAFRRVLDPLPWWLPALALALLGWRVLRGVATSARRGRVTGHTLMTVGAIAAAAAGEWSTAALLVFFMRFADWVEERTTERSRGALRGLTALRPLRAHLLRADGEVEVDPAELRPGDLIIVRPGERIAVDGEIVAGRAPVDESPLTGESIPADKEPGDTVFAATIVQAGVLRVRATRVGADTTFARIVQLVEEAESQRAPVQRFADRFAAYYLPMVLAVAGATFLLTGEALRAVAVLAVACACAIVMATPVVVLAGVGNGARRGLLVKGGIALEQLARVDTVVFDKTGTLTDGQPRVTGLAAFDEVAEEDLLAAIAALEGDSEHPLARALVREAAARGLVLESADEVRPLPGRGIEGRARGASWVLGTRRLLAESHISLPHAIETQASAWEAEGRTISFVAREGRACGLVALADVARPEAASAILALRRLGVRRLLLLTGDNEHVAARVAEPLGIDFRAGLLPEDKTQAIAQLQAEGAVVMMVGDGINDAPALSQADVGVAMGATGTAAAVEAADVALMRDDLTLVSEALVLGRRSARTIRQNLGFTGLYNLVGVGLAVTGILPPVWAAAAQVLPDVGVMLNSSRLLGRGKGAVDRADARPAPVGHRVIIELDAIGRLDAPSSSGSSSAKAETVAAARSEQR